MLCRISLKGQTPPLHIRVIGINPDDKVNVYASYKAVAPSAENFSQAFENFDSHHLRLAGEKGNKPGQRLFKSPWLYLSFVSTLGGKAELTPKFISQDKANSLKYITAKDTNKFDKSGTGVDAPAVPEQSTMLNCFETS